MVFGTAVPAWADSGQMQNVLDGLSNAYNQYYEKLKQNPGYSSSDAKALAEKMIAPAMRKGNDAKIHDASEGAYHSESRIAHPRESLIEVAGRTHFVLVFSF